MKAELETLFFLKKIMNLLIQGISDLVKGVCGIILSFVISVVLFFTIGYLISKLVNVSVFQMEELLAYTFMIIVPVINYFLLIFLRSVLSNSKTRKDYSSTLAKLPGIKTRMRTLKEVLSNLSFTLKPIPFKIGSVVKGFTEFISVSFLVFAVLHEILPLQASFFDLIPLNELVSGYYVVLLFFSSAVLFGVTMLAILGCVLIIKARVKFLKERGLEILLAIAFRAMNVYIFILAFIVIDLQFLLRKDVFICHQISDQYMSEFSLVVICSLVFSATSMGYIFVIIPALKMMKIKSKMALHILGVVVLILFFQTFSYVSPKQIWHPSSSPHAQEIFRDASYDCPQTNVMMSQLTPRVLY